MPNTRCVVALFGKDKWTINRIQASATSPEQLLYSITDLFRFAYAKAASKGEEHDLNSDVPKQ
ncbi:hypothetical protein [Parashewanella curva]|nr:hypothetical protein [Parashewanella curva]